MRFRSCGMELRSRRSSRRQDGGSPYGRDKRGRSRMAAEGGGEGGECDILPP